MQKWSVQAAEREKLNLDSNEVMDLADRQLSGTLFKICGAEILNAASPFLVLWP